MENILTQLEVEDFKIIKNVFIVFQMKLYSLSLLL